MEKRERKTSQDTPLLRALGRAHYWQRLIDDGKFRTFTEIAESEKVNVTQVRRLLRLALLAPNAIEAILSGVAKGINLEFVLRRSLPDDWRAQVAQLLQH